jgi:uncharacterized membrane protein YgcG
MVVLGAALFWAPLGLPARALAQDEPIPQPDGDMDVTTFDETLGPYGQWVDSGEGPNDGRAWRPDPDVVGEDFQPYATGGHWVYSDWGWTWESDYPWGWAPFHYGRWALTPSWGWVWYPGSVWAPAWVDWRFGGGYIGWAPLPPVGFAVVVQPWRPYWCFVPSNVFIYRDVWAYRLPVDRIHSAYAATVPVHQAVSYGRARWYAGPPVPQVEHAVGRPVPRVTGFTPPAPGRVQSVLPPSRGLAPGALAPRPGQPYPGVVRPSTPTAPGGSGWRAPPSPSPWRGGGSPAPVPSPSRGGAPGGSTPAPRPAPSAPSGPSAPGPRPRSLGYWSPQPRSEAPSYAGPRTFASPSSPRSFSTPSPGGFGAAPSRSFSTPSPGGFGGAPARSFSAPSHGGFSGAPRGGGVSAPSHGGGGGGGHSSGGGGGHSSGGGGHGGGGGRR